MALFDLTGKVAIVTGAARGIGQGIAIELARAGADICVSDIIDGNDTVNQVIALKRNAIYVKTDVSSEKSVKKLISDTMKKFNKIDILVNNAGIYRTSDTVNLSEKDWDMVVNIDLKGTFLCTREALKFMTKGGSIINTSSIAGIVGFPGAAAYCAAKGGVRLLTKELAVELGPKGIRVNSVHPGVIETPMTNDILKDANMKAGLLKSVPLGRTGKPLDIAGPVVFLASDAAAYMTGAEVVVDGGWIASS